MCDPKSLPLLKTSVAFFQHTLQLVFLTNHSLELTIDLDIVVCVVLTRKAFCYYVVINEKKTQRRWS